MNRLNFMPQRSIILIFSIFSLMVFISFKTNNSSSITVKDLKPNQIPRQLKVKGKFIQAKTWADNNGENILIVSYSGPLKEKDSRGEIIDDERYAELFAVQYLKKGKDYQVLWDIYDSERNCPFDLWIGLLPNSTFITDLDNNGVTETTLIYKLTCRSDVSPSQMKIIMHENDKKMGLRGYMTVPPEQDTLDLKNFNPDLSKTNLSKLDEIGRIMQSFGKYENENDFINKPSEFLKFAKNKWLEFIKKDEFLQLYD